MLHLLGGMGNSPRAGKKFKAMPTSYLNGRAMKSPGKEINY